MLRALRRRQRKSARKQIERELDLIEKLDLAGYFLIVWDIVRFCARQNILVQGRGSAANSAVCYALGITAVDPVGMDLLFERFLVRRTRRMAGHRSRSAERRPARTRHSICLRALWPTGRGDDRQRHHLSRTFGGARNRQGVGVRCRKRWTGLPAWSAQLGMQGRRRHFGAPFSRCRASI